MPFSTFITCSIPVGAELLGDLGRMPGEAAPGVGTVTGKPAGKGVALQRAAEGNALMGCSALGTGRIVAALREHLKNNQPGT